MNRRNLTRSNNFSSPLQKAGVKHSQSIAMETRDRISAVYEAMSPRRKTQSRSARLQQTRASSRYRRAQRPDELFSPTHQTEPKHRTSAKIFPASDRRLGSGKSALRGSTPVSSPDRTTARLHGRSAMIPYSPLQSNGSSTNDLAVSAVSRGLPEVNSGLVAPGLASSRSAFNMAMGMSSAAGGPKYDQSPSVGQGLAVSHVHADSIRVRTRNGSTTVRPSWLHPDIQVLRNPFLGLKEFLVYGRRFGTAREAQGFWEYNTGISREDGVLLGSDGYAGSVLGGSVLFAGSGRLGDSLGNVHGDEYEPIEESASVASHTDGAPADQRGMVPDGDGNLLAGHSRGESGGISTGQGAPNDNPEGLGIAARRAVRELVAVLGPLAVTRHGLSPRATGATARRQSRKRQAMDTPTGLHAGQSNRNGSGGNVLKQPKKASPRRANGKASGGGKGGAGHREPEDGLLSASGYARLAGLTTDESRAGAPLRGSRRAALERMGVRSHAAAASAYSPLRRSSPEKREYGRINGVMTGSNGAHAGRDGVGSGLMDSEQVRARLERIDQALEALLRSREQENARVGNANEPVSSSEGGPVGEASSENESSRSEPHAKGPAPPPEGYMPREQLERAIAALEAAAEQDQNYLLEQLHERDSKVAALEQQLQRAHARLASGGASRQEAHGADANGAAGSHVGQSASARAAAPAQDEGVAVSVPAPGATSSLDSTGTQAGGAGGSGEARTPPPPPER